jgi:hypothetical protein
MSKLLQLILELESLGLSMQNLNELNDTYELENLMTNLNKMLRVEYENTNWLGD